MSYLLRGESSGTRRSPGDLRKEARPLSLPVTQHLWSFPALSHPRGISSPLSPIHPIGPNRKKTVLPLDGVQINKVPKTETTQFPACRVGGVNISKELRVLLKGREGRKWEWEVGVLEALQVFTKLRPFSRMSPVHWQH